MIRNFVEELGVAIEAHGMAGVEDDVAVVVAAGRAHGLDGVALEVLADTGAPQVARWRALARITPLLLARSEAGPPATTRTTAMPALHAAGRLR